MSIFKRKSKLQLNNLANQLVEQNAIQENDEVNLNLNDLFLNSIENIELDPETQNILDFTIKADTSPINLSEPKLIEQIIVEKKPIKNIKASKPTLKTKVTKYVLTQKPILSVLKKVLPIQVTSNKVDRTITKMPPYPGQDVIENNIKARGRRWPQLKPTTSKKLVPKYKLDNREFFERLFNIDRSHYAGQNVIENNVGARGRRW